MSVYVTQSLLLLLLATPGESDGAEVETSPLLSLVVRGKLLPKTPATPASSDLEAWVGAEHGQRECQGSLVSMHTGKNMTVRIEY